MGPKNLIDPGDDEKATKLSFLRNTGDEKSTFVFWFLTVGGQILFSICFLWLHAHFFMKIESRSDLLENFSIFLIEIANLIGKLTKKRENNWIKEKSDLGKSQRTPLNFSSILTR